MGAMKPLVIFLLFISVPVIFADSAEKTEYEDIEETFIDEEVIRDAYNSAIEPYAGIYIPALPGINIEFGDAVSISLSLAKLSFGGLDNFNVTIDFSSLLSLHNITAELTFPKIALDVGHYSSGGHILNLPFNGEGTLLLALHKLAIRLNMEVETTRKFNICVIPGSTKFDLELPRFEVAFTNMNPGTDLGQLLNIVLSSFGPDIIDYLEILLNGEFHDIIDEIVVNAINDSPYICKNWVRDSPLDDERINTFVTDIFEHYMKAFKVPGRYHFDESK